MPATPPPTTTADFGIAVFAASVCIALTILADLLAHFYHRR